LREDPSPLKSITSDSIDSISDIPPGVVVTALLAGVALIGLHTWLSRRNPVLLGLVVPVLYIAIAISISVATPLTGGMIAGHVIALVGLLAIWWAGEGTRQRRRGPSAPTD